MPLTDEEVIAGCNAARKRYRALKCDDYKMAFAYELQAFVAILVEDEGHTFAFARNTIIDLINLLEEANRK